MIPKWMNAASKRMVPPDEFPKRYPDASILEEGHEALIIGLEMTYRWGFRPYLDALRGLGYDLRCVLRERPTEPLGRELKCTGAVLDWGIMKVRERIRIYREERTVEVEALFDSGSARSYLAERVARELGYELYPEPRKVPLAVGGRYADVVGYVPAVEIEIAGYRLPERETLGVVKDLVVDAIIGVNIMEPYQIVLEPKRVAFRKTPPTSHIFKL